MYPIKNRVPFRMMLTHPPIMAILFGVLKSLNLTLFPSFIVLSPLVFL